MLLLIILSILFATSALEPAADAPLAAQTWMHALQEQPEQVSLGAPPDFSNAGAELPNILKDRLRLLGRKRFSTRRWRDYWERQKTMAEQLANALPPDAEAGLAEALRAWSALAGERVANQDAYLAAIGTEQDALEERRADAMDVEVEPPARAPEEPSEPRTAYQRREARIVELQTKLRFQSDQKQEAERELQLIRNQRASFAAWRAAEAVDLELAQRERSLAADHVRGTDPWSAAWRTIAANAAARIKNLQADLRLHEQRLNDLEVEAELSQAQIDYRRENVQRLEAALRSMQGLNELAEAVWGTLTEFMRARLPRILGVLALIGIAVFAALRLVGFARAAFLRAMEDDDPNSVSQTEQRAHTVVAMFTPVAKGAVYALGTLIALDNMGVDTTPLLGSVAIVGLAVSFGAQNLVRDLVNGFFILLENQFGVGDVVEINGKGGVIESMNVRTTRFRDVSGTLHIVPNGEIKLVANRTRVWSRAVVEVGVAYGSDLQKVATILNEVGASVAADPELAPMLLEPPTCTGITSLGELAVVARVVAKTQPGKQWAVQNALHRRIHDAFSAAGIVIPFRQQVVWLKQGASA